MRRSFGVVALTSVGLLFGLLWGCDDDGATFVTESDGAAGEDVWDDFGVPDEPVERNAACEEPEEERTSGPKRPWEGLEHEGTVYTCNGCPAGKKELEASWRHIHGQTDDPDTPLDDGYVEVLTLSGNTWHQRSHGVDRATGEFIDVAEIEGWYFCSQKPENDSETTVFVTTRVEPEGAFGWNAGLVFSADVLVEPNAPRSMLLDWYEGLDTGEQIQSLYCRIGTSITNTAGESKACTDPFG